MCLVSPSHCVVQSFLCILGTGNLQKLVLHLPTHVESILNMLRGSISKRCVQSPSGPAQFHINCNLGPSRIWPYTLPGPAPKWLLSPKTDSSRICSDKYLQPSVLHLLSRPEDSRWLLYKLCINPSNCRLSTISSGCSVVQGGISRSDFPLKE